MSIRVDQLAGDITDILEEFNEATVELVDNAAKTSADHAKASLQSVSPRLTGDYARGWAVKVQSRAKKNGLAKVTVHNKTDYRLTHLLENGHQKVVWGHRVGGTVQAREHIAPVEDAAADEFIRIVTSGG